MKWRVPLPRRGLKDVVVLVIMPLAAIIIFLSSYGAFSRSDPIDTKQSYGARNVVPSIDDVEEVKQSGPSRAARLGRLWSPYRAFKQSRGSNVEEYEDEESGSLWKQVKFSRPSFLGGQIDTDRVEQGDGDTWDEDYPRRSKSGSSPRLKQKYDSEHEYKRNGLLVVNPQARHPIWDLIEKSRADWDAKQARQSKTLEEAVNNYRGRYNRSPPKGFDKWWKYAMDNNVKLVDEYDQINHDLEPFHALRPTVLRAMQSDWEANPGTYVLACPSSSGKSPAAGKAKSKYTKTYLPPDNGDCYIAETTYRDEGELAAEMDRAMGQLELLHTFQDSLKDLLDEELRVTFYAHDVPFQFVGHEYRSQLTDAAAVGEYLDIDAHEHDLAHLGWGSACSPSRRLRQEYDTDTLPDVKGFWSKHREKSFIWDHKKTMDACEFPELTHLTGFFSSHGKGPGPNRHFYPILAMCTTHLHSDVLSVAYEQFTENVGNDPPWEEKTDLRLLWRGSTTGIAFAESNPWNVSQRIRLVAQAERRVGSVSLYPPSEEDEVVGQPEQVPVGPLNDLLLDVAFVGKPIQCQEQAVCDQVEEMFEFRKRQGWDKANQYKYIFDIDGNGWSSRFKRLMSTNSLIVKSTVFPEWYADRIQAWIHYVPVKADLTDLYDVMAFFRGTNPTGTDGHDELAKQIAMEGKKWSMEYWRKEDIIAYMFRLYLEYARLMSTDREANSYHG